MRFRWMAGAITVVAALGLSVPSAAMAAPTAGSHAAAAAASPAYPVNSCQFYNAHYGPWATTRAFVNTSLAWTTDGLSGGNWVRLAVYRDALTQCTKLLGGFGGGQFEFQEAHTGLCVSVAGGSRSAGANILLEPCQSRWSQRWTEYIHNGRYQFKNVNSGLCITAPSVRAGTPLRQYGCNYYGNTESFKRVGP